MRTIEIKNATENQKEHWDTLVSHPLQSWAWGEFRKKTGVDVVRINTWQLTFHHLPHLPFTIGYFPKGPEITETMISGLTELGQQKNAIFIQLEPNVQQLSNLTIISQLNTK